jgi:uncharacterized membrane protein YqjE
VKYLIAITAAQAVLVTVTCLCLLWQVWQSRRENAQGRKTRDELTLEQLDELREQQVIEVAIENETRRVRQAVEH